MSDNLATIDRMYIKKKLREQFQSIYFTLLSIMQGVSLGVLSAQFFGSAIDKSQHWPYALVCLTYVVLVTFEYVVVYAIVWQAYVGIVDIIAIFLTGSFQYIPMYFLTSHAEWFWWVNALCLAGIGALFLSDQHVKANRDLYADNLDHELIANNRRNIVFLTCLSVILLIFNLAGLRWAMPQWLEWSMIVVLLAYCILVMYIDNRFLRKTAGLC